MSGSDKSEKSKSIQTNMEFVVNISVAPGLNI